MNKLQGINKSIHDYLVDNHFGKDKAIKMSTLAELFNLNTRHLRRIIDRIRENGTYYIVGSIRGYHAVNRENYVDRVLKSKTINSINRLLNINPEFLGVLYSELNERKKELNTNA